MRLIEQGNVRWFLTLAVVGIFALATPGPGQYYPEARRAYDAHWQAYGDQPEQMVRSWYRKYLNRDVDPVGYETWVGALRNGSPPEQILAGILASDEYYNKGGGSPQRYITVLFQDITGRPPTPQELDYWTRRLYTDQRSDIAYALLTRYPQTWGPPAPPDWRRQPPPYEYRRPYWRNWR
jgi:hypothetical protein